MGMQYAKCIDRLRLGNGNNNRITHYKLRVDLGHDIVLKSSDVKYLIRENYMQVTNLKLTSDNRLILKEEKVTAENQINPMLNNNVNIPNTSAQLRVGELNRILREGKEEDRLAFFTSVDVKVKLAKAKMLDARVEQFNDPNVFLIKSGSNMMIITSCSELYLVD